MRIKNKFQKYKIEITSCLAVILGSTIYTVGLYFFVNAIGAYAGGVTGLSQVIVRALNLLNIHYIQLGYLIILFNIPLLIFAWFKLEKHFTLLSMLSVIYSGLLLNYLEALPLSSLSDNLLLNIAFGGLFLGVGGGLALRYGSSLGGIDIIAAYVSYKSGKSVGLLTMLINVGIIVFAFLLAPENIEPILITIILFFYITLVVNQVHTKHKRFTAFVITRNPAPIVSEIQQRCGRGATLIDAHGAYSREEQVVIMTVISSYQLYIVQDIIFENDEKAFVNIVPTKDIYGNFTRNKTELPLKLK